jgi:hypothetical protein
VTSKYEGTIDSKFSGIWAVTCMVQRSNAELPLNCGVPKISPKR